MLRLTIGHPLFARLVVPLVISIRAWRVSARLWPLFCLTRFDEMWPLMARWTDEISFSSVRPHASKQTGRLGCELFMAVIAATFLSVPRKIPNLVPESYKSHEPAWITATLNWCRPAGSTFADIDSSSSPFLSWPLPPSDIWRRVFSDIWCQHHFPPEQQQRQHQGQPIELCASQALARKLDALLAGSPLPEEPTCLQSSNPSLMKEKHQQPFSKQREAQNCSLDGIHPNCWTSGVAGSPGLISQVDLGRLLAGLCLTTPHARLADALAAGYLAWRRLAGLTARLYADTCLLAGGLAEAKATADQMACRLAGLEAYAERSQQTDFLSDLATQIWQVLAQVSYPIYEFNYNYKQSFRMIFIGNAF
ncbi:unnamed protein product [Protopolystoma xenopodis]|uniref:Myotubularin phosphatase domain-containing protein n=1 Tax=Protopolystoma xenopodis TaxID=117903 RepID=A0A3S5A1S8_9PLAT|nr:unnamed protein product [Protopolystoma xenopodis]